MAANFTVGITELTAGVAIVVAWAWLTFDSWTSPPAVHIPRQSTKASLTSTSFLITEMPRAAVPAPSTASAA